LLDNHQGSMRRQVGALAGVDLLMVEKLPCATLTMTLRMTMTMAMTQAELTVTLPLFPPFSYDGFRTGTQPSIPTAFCCQQSQTRTGSSRRFRRSHVEDAHRCDEKRCECQHGAFAVCDATLSSATPTSLTAISP